MIYGVFRLSILEIVFTSLKFFTSFFSYHNNLLRSQPENLVPLCKYQIIIPEPAALRA